MDSDSSWRKDICMPKKWQFIEEELVANSIRGAFQRGKVYADSSACTERDRERLRKRLTDLLRRLATQYCTTVASEEHNQNILEIADSLTSEFGNEGILRDDKFRIGVAHKALNLYLKYLWCVGKVATPPHCPFDSQIIAKLPLTQQQRRDLKWTELESITDYQILVDAGLRKIRTTGHPSLSEWELEEWRRMLR
jgi:hypothetical protein